jgi:hypothetical protein
MRAASLHTCTAPYLRYGQAEAPAAQAASTPAAAASAADAVGTDIISRLNGVTRRLRGDLAQKTEENEALQRQVQRLSMALAAALATAQAAAQPSATAAEDAF